MISNAATLLPVTTLLIRVAVPLGLISNNFHVPVLLFTLNLRLTVKFPVAPVVPKKKSSAGLSRKIVLPLKMN